MESEYDGSSLLGNDFDDVEGDMTMEQMADVLYDGIDEDGKYVGHIEDDKAPLESTPVEKAIETPAEPIVETTTETTPELTIADLEALLGDKEVVEEVIEETIEEDKGDKNIALHQARQKASLQKQENELLKQKLEMQQKQLELLQVNNGTQEPKQEVVKTTPQQDILADLDDNDVISKADLNKILAAQQEQLTQQQQQTTQQNDYNKALQLETDFRNSHTNDLGVMSYDNIVSLHKTGRVKLSDGQLYDIKNAVSNGKNPAELYYNAIIQETPALVEEQRKADIKNMIKKIKTANGTKTEEKQESLDSDFSNMSHNSQDNLKSHFKNLSDF